MPNLIFLDVETGGLNPAMHQITQIGAVATDGVAPALQEIGEPFERKITLVQGRYTQEALNKQAYDPVVWDAEAIPITKALGDLHEWAKPFVETWKSKAGNDYKRVNVAGQKIDFDADFLTASADRCSIRLDLALFTTGKFDTLQLALWEAMRTGATHANYQLETLCKDRGVMDFTAHDALADARAALRLARSYMVGF